MRISDWSSDVCSSDLTSGLRSFRPPDGVARIILAPDGDEAGHVAARAAAVRFKEMGIEVLGTSPPPELDWCDLVAAYEERAGIIEFDEMLSHCAAEQVAGKEVLRCRTRSGEHTAELQSLMRNS